jgi:hypothetical protein
MVQITLRRALSAVSGRAPMIRVLPIDQMAHPRDVSGVVVLLRPLDCFVLRLERREHMIRVLFHDVVFAARCIPQPLVFLPLPDLQANHPRTSRPAQLKRYDFSLRNRMRGVPRSSWIEGRQSLRLPCQDRLWKSRLTDHAPCPMPRAVAGLGHLRHEFRARCVLHAHALSRQSPSSSRTRPPS